MNKYLEKIAAAAEKEERDLTEKERRDIETYEKALKSKDVTSGSLNPLGQYKMRVLRKNYDLVTGNPELIRALKKYRKEKKK